MLARRALELLATQPETEARIEREVTLLTALGVALGAMHGMAAPEVGAVHARAYELWKRVGARPGLFSVAGALWSYHNVAGRLDVALKLGDELLEMAEVTGARALQVTANTFLGITLHHLSQHNEARLKFTRAWDLCSMDLRPLFSGLPIDPGVGAGAEVTRVLWVLGYPDQAVARLHEVLLLAEQIGHPESLAFATLFGSFIHQLLNEPAKALEYGERVLALSRERDVATTLSWGSSVHGWALGATGQLEEGIAELRESLAGQRAAGAEVARPQFDWMLGDLLVRAGRFAEAGEAAEDGLCTAARTGDHYWDSELRRLEGDLVLHTGGSPADAEQHFREAIAHAASRGAKSLELRAATALARLWTSQGRDDDARRVLLPTYEWFTEAFATADLIVARDLLG